MRKISRIILIISLIVTLIHPVYAEPFTAPDVPESGQAYMPEAADNFGDGLLYIIKAAISVIKPGIAKAAGLCVSVIAVVMLTSLLCGVTEKIQQLCRVCTAVGIGILLLRTANTLINQGAATVQELSEYGKLLVPVMTAALAAQGGVNSSTALYAGTTVFSSILTVVIARLIIPLIYVFLCLAIGNSAVGDDALKKMRNFIKWIMTWILKGVLYIFTGYISITGVVGGSADASMLKATKLAISGSVPVVGGILSDASESIIVSASIMKNAAGVYGVLAIVATWIGPFLEIGVQYLMMKVTAAICETFGLKSATALLQDYSTAMGFVLAMICSICVLLLIGVVCFMKGVT